MYHRKYSPFDIGVHHHILYINSLERVIESHEMLIVQVMESHHGIIIGRKCENLGFLFCYQS